MSINPYATPEHYQPPRDAPGALEAGPWEIGEALSAGWRLFTPHWPVLVLSMFLAAAVTMAPMMAAIALLVVQGTTPDQASGDFQALISAATAAMVLTQALFEPGVVSQWLTAARGGAPGMGQLLSALRFFPSILGLRLLLAAPGLLLSGLQLAATSLEISPLVVLGTILSYVVSIGISALYALGILFAGFYVVDRGVGPIEGLRAAWAATAGQRGKVFLFTLVVGVVGSIGYLACGLGMLASLPVAGLAVTAAYLRLGYDPQNAAA